eukprot:Awhi_evm1s14247
MAEMRDWSEFAQPKFDAPVDAANAMERVQANVQYYIVNYAIVTAGLSLALMLLGGQGAGGAVGLSAIVCSLHAVFKPRTVAGSATNFVNDMKKKGKSAINDAKNDAKNK